MALPAYVVNFDELVDLISFDEVNVNFDTSAIENLLNTYFPELLELLRERNRFSASGRQKMKGFASNGEAISFIAPHDIAITGISFSQSSFDGACLDKWAVSILKDDFEIILLDDIFAKDSLQHKYFEPSFPVPSGSEILIRPPSVSAPDKTFWIDIEYLEKI